MSNGYSNYRNKSDGLNIAICESASIAATVMAQKVLSSSEAAIQSKGSFTMVVAGGSLPKALTALTTLEGSGILWDKVYIFFVDERNVPHKSPDSSYGALKEALLSKINIPAAQVHAIAENVSVHEAAQQYEEGLKALPANVLPVNEKGYPVFDMVILGIGEDAHIASLFPGWPTLHVEDKWIIPMQDSPKPPPERITFTMPLINSAKDVLFFVMGAGKAQVVKQVLEKPSPNPEPHVSSGVLPAQMVEPTSGNLLWMLEPGSAANLSLDELWAKC